MKNKNLKMKKGIEAVLEISILIVSIFAIGYVLGDEFRLVSAKDNSKNPCPPDEMKDYCGRFFRTIGKKDYGCDGTKQCATTEKCVNGACIIPKEKPSSKPDYAAAAILLTKDVASKKVVEEKIKEGLGAKKGKEPDIIGNIEKNWMNLLFNVAATFGAYAGGNALALWAGYSEKSSNQLGLAAAVGYGTGAFIYFIGNTLGGGGMFAAKTGLFAGAVPYLSLIGVAAGAGLWLFFMKDYSFDLITYNCNSWQPAKGGTDCDKCNWGQFPCTKYKCQSLGQSCELANEGTGEEKCFWNNRNDISPPTIRAWKGILSQGYEYLPDDATLAPDTGVIINNTLSKDGCVPPFTILKYGVALDKLGHCKWDVVRTKDYESMKNPMSSMISKYNHSLISYSGGIGKAEGGVSLANGGDYEVYVRCESQNGYSNVGTFVFKYCISDEPDISAPSIITTDPINGYPVAYAQTEKDVNIYVNKPSECRWSHSDVDFDLMTETMLCSSSETSYNANMVFKCSTTLTGLKDGVSNNFYFRCKSYPGEPEEKRYKNIESYKYTLLGTRPLVLDWVKPNGTIIKDSTTSVQVTLEAHTSAGYKEGKAQCYYKESSQSDANYVLFFATNSFQHSQVLWLETGNYEYDIKCCDLGGNCETAPTEFEVETDVSSPMVIRIYNDNNKLKIVTDEKAECVYSTTDCNYLFADGLKLTTSDYKEHLAEWNTASNLYIKCQDEFGNQPFPNNACSITIRPFSEYVVSSSTA